MRVVVRDAFKAYINMQPEEFTPGQKIKGDTAVLLLRSRAAVDPDDDEAAGLAQALADEDQADGDTEPPPPHAPPPPSTNPDGGPTNPEPSGLDIEGPVKDVLTWVGEDPDRARQALAAEQAKEQPRSTLVKQLEKTADPGQ